MALRATFSFIVNELHNILSARGDAFGRCSLGSSTPGAIRLTGWSLDAPTYRSRRGEAPKGSSFFSQGVEARSAEDPGNRWRV